MPPETARRLPFPQPGAPPPGSCRKRPSPEGRPGDWEVARIKTIFL